ncbi:MAG: hypothetical protein V7K47_12520 [Nostoc sp.]
MLERIEHFFRRSRLKTSFLKNVLLFTLNGHQEQVSNFVSKKYPTVHTQRSLVIINSPQITAIFR